VTTVEVVFFPLDEQLELWDKHWSEGIAKEAVWISGVVDSFAEAEQVMGRIGHVSMSDSTVWRWVEKWGKEFRGLEKERQEQAQTVPRRGEIIVGQAKQSEGHSQRTKDLRTEAQYFENNKRRMQYLEEEGYPLGSGMVESGAKQFSRLVLPAPACGGAERALNVLFLFEQPF